MGVGREEGGRKLMGTGEPVVWIRGVVEALWGLFGVHDHYESSILGIWHVG